MATHRNVIQAFNRDQSGAIAVVFALLLVPVLLAIGLALDYGVASKHRSVMQKNLDAAVLAGAAALAKTNYEKAAEKTTRRRFNATKAVEYETVLVVKADADKRSVIAKATSKVPTMLLGLAGVPVFEVVVGSAAGLTKAPKRRRRRGRRKVQLDDVQINDLIYRIEQYCNRVQVRIASCRMVRKGTFEERLRKQLAHQGSVEHLVPGGIGLVR